MSRAEKPRIVKVSPQGEEFVNAARALECDESEERFDAALKKIAAHMPPKDSENGAPIEKAKPTEEGR